MKTISKLTFLLTITLFYSCEKEEFIEKPDAEENSLNTFETSKSTSICEVTVKDLASHTRIIYRANDDANSIRVNEWRNGRAITIRTNSGVCKIPRPYDELVIYAGKGNDSIIINRSVKTPVIVYAGDGNDFVRNTSSVAATLVTLGDGTDKVRGNRENTRFWIDPEDLHNASSKEIDAGKLNIVASFENSDKILDGPEIWDEDRFTTFANSEVPWDYIPISETSLWGIDLPSPYDVQQGFFQRCYTTAKWASIANHSPEKVRELAVELGDGTYAVKIGGEKYARVDEDILPFHLSRPGVSGKSWFVFLQKAYSSKNLDYPEPLTSEFVDNLTTSGDEYTEAEYLSKLQQYLDAGHSLQTFSSRKNLDIGVSQYHVHTILGIQNDKIIVRNPYGDVYDALWKPEYNPNFGRIELSYDEFKTYFSSIRATQEVWE